MSRSFCRSRGDMRLQTVAVFLLAEVGASPRSPVVVAFVYSPRCLPFRGANASKDSATRSYR